MRYVMKQKLFSLGGLPESIDTGWDCQYCGRAFLNIMTLSGAH